MATGTTSVPTDFSPAAQRRIDPAKYTALADFIDEINKPDNRESLVKTYGDQGITGFLQMTGATKAAGTNDEVQWWEETRLHPQQPFNYSAGDVQTLHPLQVHSTEHHPSSWELTRVSSQQRCCVVQRQMFSAFITGMASWTTLLLTQQVLTLLQPAAVLNVLDGDCRCIWFHSHSY